MRKIEASAPHPGAPDLSIVSPVYGCHGCLEELADRLEAALAGLSLSYELILVDDASPDGSWQRIREISAQRRWVVGVRLSRNFGQHAAISAGLLRARGQQVVVMDCDLQDRPEEIPSLLAGLAGGSEVALAQRVERQDNGLKRFGSWAFYRFLGWLTGTAYDHTTANFGAYSRRAVDAVNAMPESERFFPLLMRWNGFSTVKIPIVHDARTHGASGYSLRKLMKLAASIALSFSDKPLRLVVVAALASAAVALLIAAFSISRYFAGDIQIAGFTSIVASIWLVGSATLGSIGVLGLYVGRIFHGVKARPAFVVGESTDD